MQYTQEQLTKLLADVEKEFTTHLAKAEENFKLAKSEDSAAPSVDGTETLAKAEDEKSEDAKEKKEDKEPAKEAPKAESKEDSKEAAAEEKGEEEGEEEQAAADEAAEEAPAAEAAPAHGYDEEDLAHMREMYSSMSFEELMAHHDAVKECLDAMAAEQAAPAEAAAPEAPAAEAAPAPRDAAQTEIDKCGDMQMAKSEAAPEVELVKSELAAEKAKSEELKKNLDAVSEFLTKLVTKKTAPAGKAITSVETIAKSEVETEAKTLSKGEITTILTKKAADPKLSKSDREAINAYYGAGQVSIEKIKHLLA